MSRAPILAAARRPLSDEGGAALVYVAFAITALMSAVALAIDVGMLLTARSEAQRAADAAALAGAGILIFSPDDESGARAEAIAVGGANTIIGEPAEILPSDVDVDLVAGRVEVTVRRTGARGNAVPTWFAPVFGTDLVDVSARAVAGIFPGSGATCLKPFAVPDAWFDADADGVFDLGTEYYDPATYGYGTVSGSLFRNAVYLDNGIDPPGTTYDQDRGRPLVLKPGKPRDAIQPGWFFPWDIPQPCGPDEEDYGLGCGPSAGGDRYRSNIATCNTAPIALGSQYMVETGNMIGPTKQGIDFLITQDPYATWDMATQSVINSAYDPPEASPRVVRLPLFDPSLPIEPGKRPIVFTNLTSFFIVGIQGNDVIGRFLELSGYGVGGEAATMPNIKYVRLIE